MTFANGCIAVALLAKRDLTVVSLSTIDLDECSLIAADRSGRRYQINQLADLNKLFN